MNINIEEKPNIENDECRAISRKWKWRKWSIILNINVCNILIEKYEIEVI